MSERKITLKTPDSKRPLGFNETIVRPIPKLPKKVEPFWVDSDTLEPIETALHKGSMYNYDKIHEYDCASCFGCLEIFESAADIKRWTDDGQTAICPKCGIDSIIPAIVSKDILVLMHHEYFCTGTNMSTGEEIDCCDC